MANLSSLLYSVTAFFSKGLIKNSLTGAGLALGSYAVLQTIYASFLSYLQTNFGQLANIFYAINLSGLDVALSMLISAVNVRIFLNSKQLFLRKASS
jgi:hypothetical protein